MKMMFLKIKYYHDYIFKILHSYLKVPRIKMVITPTTG